MMDVLVFGGEGQLGRAVGQRASQVGLSCQTLTRHDLDICQRDNVLKAVERFKPVVVVNAAGYTDVDKAEEEQTKAFSVNRDGAAYLAEASATQGAALFHISTDYVFDGTKSVPYREDDPVAPLGVYGASKLAGEEAVRQELARHVILRTSWVFGAHKKNFVKTILERARDQQTLRVVDDQFGCPTFAGDLADAAIRLASMLRAGQWARRGFGTFHCAGQGVTTWCGFARAVVDMAEPSIVSRPRIEAIDTNASQRQAQRPAYSALNCDKLAEIHGIRLRPWQSGLSETLEALLPWRNSDDDRVRPAAGAR